MHACPVHTIHGPTGAEPASCVWHARPVHLLPGPRHRPGAGAGRPELASAGGSTPSPSQRAPSRRPWAGQGPDSGPDHPSRRLQGAPRSPTHRPRHRLGARVCLALSPAPPAEANMRRRPVHHLGRWFRPRCPRLALFAAFPAVSGFRCPRLSGDPFPPFSPVFSGPAERSAPGGDRERSGAPDLPWAAAAWSAQVCGPVILPSRA